MHIGCSFSPQWRSDERHSTTLFWFQKKKRHMEDDLDISDITSLASSLLYEGGNKSRSWDKNLRKFNSLTSNFLPLPQQWVGTMLQSTVTSGTKHGEVLELMRPDLKKGSIFLPSNGRISANWVIAIYGGSLVELLLLYTHEMLPWWWRQKCWWWWWW